MLVSEKSSDNSKPTDDHLGNLENGRPSKKGSYSKEYLHSRFVDRWNDQIQGYENDGKSLRDRHLLAGLILYLFYDPRFKWLGEGQLVFKPLAVTIHCYMLP